MLVLSQWMLSQLLKGHSRLTFSGSNTDCMSCEPHKASVMLCCGLVFKHFFNILNLFPSPGVERSEVGVV